MQESWPRRCRGQQEQLWVDLGLLLSLCGDMFRGGEPVWCDRQGWFLETVLGLNPGCVTWPSYITSLSLIYKM